MGAHARLAAPRRRWPVAETTVVNLRREAYDIYIGRAGHGHDGFFGNPFTLKEHRQKALELFKDYFEQRVETDDAFRARAMELHGKRLGCFCKPGPCHGDIIARWVDDQVGLDLFLAECAKSCTCCGTCWSVPCDGCQAGGICDEMTCRCEDASADEYAPDSDDEGDRDGC